jgi:hypothetical protein
VFIFFLLLWWSSWWTLLNGTRCIILPRRRQLLAVGIQRGTTATPDAFGGRGHHHDIMIIRFILLLGIDVVILQKQSGAFDWIHLDAIE